MSNIKRLAIIVLIVCCVVLVASSFMGSEVSQRSIIVGLGVDIAEKGVKVTAEVISPGNGGEQIGTFSKTVTAQGDSVAQAIKGVAEKTGKEASLGQCLLLILGEEYFSTVRFDDVIEYFIKSDSFRESAIVCCCQGSAEDLMNKGDALTQSVSLSLVNMMLDQAEKIGIASNNLLKFARSQTELHKTGFLNYVKFTPSQNKDSQNPDQEQGFFVYREAIVFRDYTFLYHLTEQEARGFYLFEQEPMGENFVSNATGETLTLNVNDKNVSGKLQDGTIALSIKLSLNLARTDSADESGAFSYKEKTFIPDEVLQDAKKQAYELAENFLRKQQEYNFDLIDLHETIRQKEGTSKQLAELPTKEIPVTLEVSVEEK